MRVLPLRYQSADGGDVSAARALEWRRRSDGWRSWVRSSNANSRSVASIVAGNVFTLFNLIIGGLLHPDPVARALRRRDLRPDRRSSTPTIGIRQEMKAKETLDRLAILVAPRAKAIRDGQEIELLADEIVPGDMVRIGPGDQLVADGTVLDSRGPDPRRVDADRRGRRDRQGHRRRSALRRLRDLRLGPLRGDAVRDDSYAGQIAGEARAFRHPPSPLEREVNRVIVACTQVLVPLGDPPDRFASTCAKVELVEAAQTATAGLITLIPEGLVLLMSVTFAVAAVPARQERHARPADERDRIAGLGRHDLRRQDRHADRRRPDPGRDRVRLRRPTRSCAERCSAATPPSAGDQNRTLEAIGDEFPARARAGPRRGHLLLASGSGRGLTFEEDGDRSASCSAPPT